MASGYNMIYGPWAWHSSSNYALVEAGSGDSLDLRKIDTACGTVDMASHGLWCSYLKAFKFHFGVIEMDGVFSGLIAGNFK